jgi:hypothetical protein
VTGLFSSLLMPKSAIFQTLVAAQQIFDLAKGAELRGKIRDAVFHLAADPERIVHQGNSDLARQVSTTST